MGRIGEALERLVDVMAKLRAEGGCPWDREQDIRSLRPYLVEETYEVLDEMDCVAHGGPWRKLCEELGDLLFQIVFHAQLGRELGEFDMADVCNAIADKIVSRHPHVFGELRVSGAEQVLENWAKLKAQERKKRQGHEGSVLDGVPSAAPALMRAERLTEKASRIGFDWPDLKGVRSKLDEELAELDQAIAKGDRDELEHELGDVLFALANLARFIKTPPEDALRQANRRFTERFQQIEAELRAQGVPFGEATLEQMDALWQKAKEREKALPPIRHPPRAAVCRIRLPARELSATAAFVHRVGALLGWQRIRHDGSAVRVDVCGVELCWERRDGSPVALELEAPSQRAVEAVAHSLGLRPSGASVRMTDPDGNAFTYATPQAGLST